MKLKIYFMIWKYIFLIRNESVYKLSFRRTFSTAQVLKLPKCFLFSMASHGIWSFCSIEIVFKFASILVLQSSNLKKSNLRYYCINDQHQYHILLVNCLIDKIHIHCGKTGCTKLKQGTVKTAIWSNNI